MSRTDSAVLLLTPDMALDGGVTNYYRQLQLDRLPDVEYFAVNSPTANSSFAKLKFFLPTFVRYLTQLRQVDAVHVNPSLNAGSYYRDALFTLFARLANKTTLVTMHGWSYDFEQKIQHSALSSWLFRISFAQADAFIVLGNTFKERLRGLGLPVCTPVYVDTTIADDNGFDPARVREKKKDRSVIRFLFLARIVKEKGLDIALSAFDLCRQRHPEQKMHFHVAGDGPDLADIRRQWADDPDISFLGHVDDQVRQPLLERCHFLLFPTYHGEGLPCTILECMLYGMPVLTRPEGAIGEIIINEEHGLLTDSREPEPYADYAGKLILDPDAYTDVSERNMAEAMERYRAEAVQQRVLSIYRTVFPALKDTRAPASS